jgi:DNA-binding transcriptional LysR family regulator
MRPPGLDTLRGLLVFAHVAETLSFSRAAERLGVTKSAVSKHVAQLEHAFAVQLIVRTTRKLVLTEAGERVYASCARIAGDLEAAREAAAEQSSVIAGALRVTAPSELGRNYLVPVVDEFMRRHPQVTFDLMFGDAFVDLVAERVDIALRVGGRAEASLVSRRVSSVEFFVVASPNYLEVHGTPRAPAELSSHDWLVHTPSGAVPRVTLRKGARKTQITLRGRFSCNDGPANLEAARLGMGLVVVPDFVVARDVHDGRLVRVLPSWKIDAAALHLVFPPRRHVLGRVRAFADFVVERFRDPPWRCRA